MPVTNTLDTEAPAVDEAGGGAEAVDASPRRRVSAILRELISPLQIWNGALLLWKALGSFVLALSGVILSLIHI